MLENAHKFGEKQMSRLKLIRSISRLKMSKKCVFSKNAPRVNGLNNFFLGSRR